jgi:hypothetical protein
MNRLYQVLIIASATACASNQGTHPNDMSEAGHEHAATSEDRMAAEHEAMAGQPDNGCAANRAGTVCWTEDADHAAMAEQHREMAAKHRAASQALVDAENNACVGIPEDDRDTSPFAHRSDITQVTKLMQASNDSGSYGGPEGNQVAGATISFRAVPGMTKEWLQRVMDCHAARNASMGYQMQDMNYCPLMVPGARAKVRSGHGGFDVDVTADTADSVQQIIARAEALH